MHPLLEQVLEANDNIEACARNNQWTQVEEQAKQRLQLLKKYFAIRPLPDSHETIYSVAEAIQKNDKSVERIIAREKKTAIRHSLNLKAKAHAINTYRGNASC